MTTTPGNTLNQIYVQSQSLEIEQRTKKTQNFRFRDLQFRIKKNYGSSKGKEKRSSGTINVILNKIEQIVKIHYHPSQEIIKSGGVGVLVKE